MKLIYILLLIVFTGVNQYVLAQDSKSTVTLLTPASQEDKAKLTIANTAKFLRIEQSKKFKQVQLVKIGNLAKIQKKGVLTFTLPGSAEKFTYFANKVDAQSESDFTWIGVSADKLSTAIFICRNGKLSGAFNINEKSFQLYGAGEGLSLLLEDRTDLPANCNVEGSAYISKQDMGSKGLKELHGVASAGVCTERTRVLVLYTQNASNLVPDINGVIDVSIQQYNTTISNSGIGGQTNFIEEAGRQLITFASNSPENVSLAGDAADRVRDNATVQSLRNQYNADLVVCLVDHAYSNNAVGSTSTVPSSISDYAAIVQVNYSANPTNFTFTHEMGHLMGGRHQNDTGGPLYSHGFTFTTNPPSPGTPRQVRTMMHTTVAGSTRIMNYSNPIIFFEGTPTGTFDMNYVAKRIMEVSPLVVNYRPSVTQSFNAYIDGPDNITQSGYYNWTLLTFCRNYQTTDWRFSTDGFNYGSPVGAGDAVNNYYMSESDNGTLYLKCTIVTDQNQTYVTTKTITVNICSGCRTAAAANEEPEVRVNKLTSIFPNPADKKLAISYQLYQHSDVDIEFVDLIGRSRLKRELKDVSSGSHVEELDVSNLTKGMYVCRLKLGDRIINKSVVVSK